MDNNKSNKVHLIILGGLILACLVVVVLLLTGCSANGDNGATSTETIVLSEEKLEQVEGAAAVGLTEKGQEGLMETVNEAVSVMQGMNLFLNIQEGEEAYVTTVLNSQGEAFSQNSTGEYLSVYRKDNQAIRFGEYIDFGYDSNVFEIIWSAVDMANNGHADIATSGEEQDIEGFTSAIIDIRGWDGIKELYTAIDEEFGDIMVEQLKTSIASAETDDITEADVDQQVNFRLWLVINDEYKSIDQVDCYIYFGDKANTDVTWDDLRLNWGYAGFVEVGNWELDAGWYDMPWETLAEWEDITEAEDLLLNQFNSLMVMLEEYMPKADNTEGTEVDGAVTEGEVEDTAGTTEPVEDEVDSSTTESEANVDETVDGAA